MVLAVVARHLHVDVREPGTARRHRLFDTVLHGRDELPRDRAADHLVGELEARATRQRLHAQVGDGELTVAPGLLFVPTLGGGGLDDRAAVGVPPLLDGDLDGVLALQSLEHDGEVGVAHHGEHGLARLVVLADAQSRVLFFQAVQAHHELVLVALLAGHDGDLVGGHRARGQGQLDVEPLLGEHVARHRVGELGDRDEVARGHGLDRDELPSPRHLQRPQPLVGPRPRVEEHRVGTHGAAHDLKPRHPADEGVEDRLEGSEDRRPVGVSRYLDHVATLGPLDTATRCDLAQQ